MTAIQVSGSPPPLAGAGRVEAGAGLRAQTMSQALVLAAELVARADRRDAMAAAARR